VNREMPNCPAVDFCHCYGTPDHCVCGSSEKALRGWLNGRISQPMSAEQREWCFSEIDLIEGYDRKDYEGSTDANLAMGVLSAWLEYCRDKGLA